MIKARKGDSPGGSARRAEGLAGHRPSRACQILDEDMYKEVLAAVVQLRPRCLFMHRNREPRV